MGGEGVAEPQSHCPEQAEQFVDMEQEDGTSHRRGNPPILG